MITKANNRLVVSLRHAVRDDGDGDGDDDGVVTLFDWNLIFSLSPWDFRNQSTLFVDGDLCTIPVILVSYFIPSFISALHRHPETLLCILHS